MGRALDLNDRPGSYPPSWYAASAEAAAERPALQGEARADLCIVGAGYTGLWAALTAARAGLSVIVLDAHRTGWGGSGRNGGQVHSGYNKSQAWLEARIGAGPARALWELCEAGKAQLVDFCAREAPEARWTPGLVHADYTAREARETAAGADWLARHYGHEAIRPLDRAGIRDLVRTDAYAGGHYDAGGGHLHPFRYALALARAAEAAGAVIHERSEVHAVEPGPEVVIRTGQGRVRAGHAILAGNGYLPRLGGPSARYRDHVMPLNSFIAATEPLPERWQEVLTQDVAVADSRHVVNYYRFSEDRRLLFGGRAAPTLRFPDDITEVLRARMVELFPQLGGVRVDYGWGGTLGITPTRLPYLARLAPNVLAAGGYSGHGVALSGMAGTVMAKAVLGQAGEFDAMALLPAPRFPGGAMFQAPLLRLAMGWFALRDRLSH